MPINRILDEVNGLLPDGPEEVIEQKLEGR